MDIVLYSCEYKEDWDNFIHSSPEKLFLLFRDYVDYHSCRFKDNSLLFFENGRLLALLPANVKDGVLYSHGGLTYGGVVSKTYLKAEQMASLFSCLKDYAQNNGLKRLIYKPPPICYRNGFAEEDLYSLFFNGGGLISRNLSSCIDLSKPYFYRESKKRSVRKAIKKGVVVGETLDYRGFFQILSEVLHEKHNKIPVHTVEEMRLLSSTFPENIKLYGAYCGGQMLAGTVIYEYLNTVHTQYIAVSAEGKPVRALDCLLDWLITLYSENKKYFDFGVSTENNGRYLNMSLVFQKEGFGAKGLCYDTYELNFV